MTAPKHRGFIINTKKGRGGGVTSGSWKPGQSGNPKGSPKRADTWGALFKRYGDMTGPELVARLEQMKVVDDFSLLPKEMKLKELVVISTFAQMLKDPKPGLLEQMMERTEGKVADKLQAQVTSRTIVLDHNAQPLGKAEHTDDDDAPGE